MDANEIDTMPAGRNLDALVAEKAFGTTVVWVRGNVFREDKTALYPDLVCNMVHQFSTDIASAWRIVNAVGDSFYHVKRLRDGGYEAAFVCGIGSDASVSVSLADTAPLAICRAALKLFERMQLTIRLD